MEQETIEIKKLRDERTPDLFHTLTESDIDIISLKLSEEPKARFKNYLDKNIIREFIVYISDRNPSIVTKLQKYKKRRKSKKNISATNKKDEILI